MARIRSVKPELRTSLTVAEWPREVRYFWVLLWGYLDDHGRGADVPKLVKADCFPLDDDLTADDIDKWLELFTVPQDDDEPAPLCRYVVGGRRFMHAPRWRNHQKPQHPTDSKIPPCPRGKDCGRGSRTAHEDFMNPHDDLSGGHSAGANSSGAAPEGQDQGGPAGETDDSTIGAGQGQFMNGSRATHESLSGNGVSNTPSPTSVRRGEGEGDVDGEGDQKEKPAKPRREDVERLCLHLADRIERNGSKRPNITEKWRDAARLMIDNDGRTEEQIHTAIDWCQDDEFWRINIESMPTLRRQYDKVRLAAQRGQRSGRAPSTPKQVNYTDEEYTSGW